MTNTAVTYASMYMYTMKEKLLQTVRTCRCFAKLPALDRLWNSKQIQLRPKRRHSTNYALEAAIGRWWLRLSWSEERKKALTGQPLAESNEVVASFVLDENLNCVCPPEGAYGKLMSWRSFLKFRLLRIFESFIFRVQTGLFFSTCTCTYIF